MANGIALIVGIIYLKIKIMAKDMSDLMLKLKLLEDKQKREGKTFPKTRGHKVYYGWAKLNKIRKKEAISVIFENDEIPQRSQGFVSKMQNTVYTRYQTPEEEKDALSSIRSFTEYSIFLDSKNNKGSLFLTLHENFIDDGNNVDELEKIKIRDLLKMKFLEDHPTYKEPTAIQLSLFDF